MTGRRNALRHHSPWPAVAPWPTVSIVLSSHRSDRLAHALSMVRAQDYLNLQVIVVLTATMTSSPPPPECLPGPGWLERRSGGHGVAQEQTLATPAAASARAEGEPRQDG